MISDCSFESTAQSELTLPRTSQGNEFLALKHCVLTYQGTFVDRVFVVNFDIAAMFDWLLLHQSPSYVHPCFAWIVLSGPPLS